MAQLSDLVGKTCIQVIRRDDEIIFVCDDARQYRMYHDQDCCKSVTVEEINNGRS